MRIVLDPGHGGKDPGAIGAKAFEKNINLSVAKLVKDNLVKRGHKVVMTRGNDSFVSLETRCKIANNFKADVLISIHCNSSFKRESHGTETLYKSAKGHVYANMIQKNVVKVLKTTDRGTKVRDDLWMLNGTKMPAALVELAFISNPLEERMLLSQQKEIADSIASVIK